ncbi:M10 family metallopeptidase C-terminal domain-containing protein [Mycoplana sp. MJR14]|uniref:M10 family metallopeptidase C-terminal domain-containing protein n=1 Tax=Mycoplana sp. MJR14 TaxID=3032583 RepID=UPI0023DB439B|nr:M10 family metallopeptidase C-terminal domain-containing protein [Mycoplana sp. MJR14]MDF1631728.1 M10 family metallopeptidase C-terminal domain-containing protein [Mycoplana sp. MJR14]
MGTITSNISSTLNGSTEFTVGTETYQWFNRSLDYLDVTASGGTVRTATLTFSGEAWTAGILRFTGSTRAVINDTTTGTTDADRVFIQYISTTNSAENVITLKNAEVDIIYGGGIEKVTIGYWVSQLNLNRGDDEVSVVGMGEAGDISLGRGNDILKTASGRIGTVTAAQGMDKVYLGKGGADYINLGKDADWIKVAKLADKTQQVVLNGGEGVDESTGKDSDSIVFAAFTKALTIDLNGQYAVKTGSGDFHIHNFENAMGGSGKDKLIASVDANIFSGDEGADTFVFKSRTAANGDKILDFSRSEKDRIDLSVIDASTKSSGGQAFTFIGKAGFHDKAGELRYEVKSGDTRIQGDVNGDGVADFTITIDASLTLKSGDFLL